MKPLFINQAFGENQACVSDFGLPTQKVTGSNSDGTCPIGSEKLYQRFGMRGHNGLDLATGEQRCSNSCKGTVIEISSVPARGLGVGVLSDIQYDFGPLGIHYAKVRYWHFKEIYVKAGQELEIGDALGVTDNTGYSAGNHLHFELDLFDKDAGGHPVQFFDPSMIAGSIDPAPYFQYPYAENYVEVLSIYQKIVNALTAFLAEYNKK